MTLPPASNWLLALESSGSRGGAALLNAGEVVRTADLEAGLRHGRDLMPAAAAIIGESGLTPGELTAVAVSIGPGSYTGLRVGVMAAKALAYALGIPLVGVSSLEALAETVRLRITPDPDSLIVVIQNARRDEAYFGAYRAAPAGAAVAFPDRATTPEEAAAHLAGFRASGGRTLCAGTGLTKYAELFPAAVAATDITCPDAAAVGLIGWRRFLRGQTADPFQIQPVYLRRDPDAGWRHDILMR